MSGLLIILCFVGFLAAATFLSGRKFGVLALGIVAGLVVAQTWTTSLVQSMLNYNLAIPGAPRAVVAALVLLFLPPFLLIIAGPQYPKKITRIVAASGIALFAFAASIQAAGRYGMIDGIGVVLHRFVGQQWSYIVTILIILAIFDILLSQKTKSPSVKKH